MPYESIKKTNKMGKHVAGVFTSKQQRVLPYEDDKFIRVLKRQDGKFFLFGCDIVECVGYKNKYETIKKNDPVKRIARVFSNTSTTAYRDYNIFTLDETLDCLPKKIKRMNNNVQFLNFLKENATNEKLEELFKKDTGGVDPLTLSESMQVIDSEILVKIDGEPIGFLPNTPSYMIQDPILQAIKFSQERELANDLTFDLTNKLQEQAEQIKQLQAKMDIMREMQEKLIEFSKGGAE